MKGRPNRCLLLLPVAQSSTAPADDEICQRAIARLTWAHNVLLIQKVKDLPARFW
jgi:hypothetical protein